MELRLYLDIFKRRFLLIIIVVAVAMSVLTSAALLAPPVYTARATVRVLLDVGISDFTFRDEYSSRLLNTYAHILQSEPLLETAISTLSPRVSLTASELRERVEVEVVPGTELITVAAEHRDPILARDLSNTLAGLLVEYAQNLYVGNSKSTRQIVEEQLASIENELEVDQQRLAALLASGTPGAESKALEKQIEFKEDSYDRLLDRYELARLNESLRANSITIVNQARVPSGPSNAPGIKEIGLGLVVGGFCGVGLALALENIDTRVHSVEQLEHLTHLTALSSVPEGLLTLDSSGNIDSTDVSKGLAEAYRLLVFNLLTEDEAASRTILVTSVISSECKPAVAANLASALAERGQTIFLVDADLRRPTLDRLFEIDGGLGLTDLLADRRPISQEVLGQALRPVEHPNLFVITAGSSASNPTSLLARPTMAQLISSLKAQGQTTLLYTPPVLGMADVPILASMVDKVILVVSAGVTERRQLQTAIRQLQAGGGKLSLVFVQKGGKDWYCR